MTEVRRECFTLFFSFLPFTCVLFKIIIGYERNDTCIHGLYCILRVGCRPAGRHSNRHLQQIPKHSRCSRLPQRKIILVPKKSNGSCLNDYRPVALTPTIAKCFEREQLDPLQFAYHPDQTIDSLPPGQKGQIRQNTFHRH